MQSFGHVSGGVLAFAVSSPSSLSRTHEDRPRPPRITDFVVDTCSSNCGSAGRATPTQRARSLAAQGVGKPLPARYHGYVHIHAILHMHACVHGHYHMHMNICMDRAAYG